MTEEKEIDMGLTRSFLKGMGITDEQVSAIIEAHTETTEALKGQRDSYKADADKLKDVQRELDELKSDGSDWQKKYEKEHADFETYKKDRESKDVLSAKKSAYTELLRKAGINEKRINGILKLTDLSSFELDDKGEIKDADKVSEGIKTEWSDFIPNIETQGAGTHNPPDNDDDPSDLSKLSMDEYIKARKK